MTGRVKPQILCVDDEPRVVEGLALILKREYEVHAASSAEHALQKLREIGNLSVIVSDMRMPKMDGAAFLHEAMMRRPDASRILLTGQADRDEAIRAVNQGQIFRFLQKPCPPEELKSAIEAGVIQYRLLNAERAVLQETLLGCISALVEVLSVANPVAFGRASHVKRRAMQMATRLGIPEFWQLNAAAQLSQLGYAALEPSLMEKVYGGQSLSPEEQVKVDAVPDMANRLLEHIPRLEPVIQILAALKWNDSQVAALGEGTIGLGSQILGLILEYDSLSARGLSHERACEYLWTRLSRYAPKLLDHLDICEIAGNNSSRSIEILLRQVTPGTILLQELRNNAGVLITPKGFEVTKSFVERMASLAPELLDTKVRTNIASAATSDK